jgi:hypothetical protein
MLGVITEILNKWMATGLLNHLITQLPILIQGYTSCELQNIYCP